MLATYLKEIMDILDEPVDLNLGTVRPERSCNPARTYRL